MDLSQVTHRGSWMLANLVAEEEEEGELADGKKGNGMETAFWRRRRRTYRSGRMTSRVEGQGRQPTTTTTK